MVDTAGMRHESAAGFTSDHDPHAYEAVFIGCAQPSGTTTITQHPHCHQQPHRLTFRPFQLPSQASAATSPLYPWTWCIYVSCWTNHHAWPCHCSRIASPRQRSSSQTKPFHFSFSVLSFPNRQVLQKTGCSTSTTNLNFFIKKLI